MLLPLTVMASDWKLARTTQTSAVVIDQFGKKRRFYDELIKNKTVAINFIFASCTSSCPLATAIFRQVQKQLKDLKNLQFISISVDPEHDRPADLMAYGKKFYAETNWVFLTGSKANLSGVLKELDAYTANPNEHGSMVIIGDAGRQEWVRLYGLPQAETLITELKRIAGESQAR
jgi:protein SCO1